jgi:hypothetical protein
MRTKTTTTTLYQFDKLSAKAQQTALESCADINVDDSFWYESITDDIAEFGKASGFGCEYGGEFDCDRGDCIFIKDISTTVPELLANLPRMHDFPNIYQEVIAPLERTFTPKEWRQLARLDRTRYLASLSGQTSRHRQGMQSDIERFDYGNRSAHITRLLDTLEEAWAQMIRDLESCYVGMLRDEYAYKTSEEAIRETIDCNAYKFTEAGHVA